MTKLYNHLYLDLKGLYFNKNIQKRRASFTSARKTKQRASFTKLTQGIVDGSASQPTQDTNYMVEKTYHIAPYFGGFGAYLMPEGPV